MQQQEADDMALTLSRAPIHVLVIEDNIGDAILLKETLGETGLNITCIDHIQTLDASFTFLETRNPDIIFLDLSLPDSVGIESFNALQQFSGETPIVILTGINDTGIALDTINKGAQDFLVKGNLDANMLTKTILYSIERKRI